MRSGDFWDLSFFFFNIHMKLLYLESLMTSNVMANVTFLLFIVANVGM